MTSPAELQAQADAIEWYHTIDLGQGVVTKGKGVQETMGEILPDVSGRSVLDIGAWDGKFSFSGREERRQPGGGARPLRVGYRLRGPGRLLGRVHPQRDLADQSRDETDFWRPDLPGRRGFDLAKAALGSRVEPVVADFQKIDLDDLGQFDVVLYLGVLYHMKEPLTCLERVRAVTKEVAVIETEALHLEGLEHEALMQFHAGSSLRTDFGNWYVPTIEALHNLCRAAGFSEVRTVVGPPAPPAGAAAEPLKVRVGRRIAGTPPPHASAPSSITAPWCTPSCEPAARRPRLPDWPG